MRLFYKGFVVFLNALNIIVLAPEEFETASGYQSPFIKTQQQRRKSQTDETQNIVKKKSDKTTSLKKSFLSKFYLVTWCFSFTFSL